MALNSIGRDVPAEAAGRLWRPYQGPFEESEPKKLTINRMIHPVRPGESKLLPDLKTAIRATGLQNGMTISFHHAFREGDLLIGQTLSVIRELGIRGLRFAPSAVINLRDTSLLDYVRDGTIDRVEASGIRGELGDAVLAGEMNHPVILRPHGDRPRAIEAGELHIDVAFIAASAADDYGNCTGHTGANVCGSLGYAFIDAYHADRVVVVTDTLVEYPCCPVSISQQYVDFVVKVDRIGDPERIGTGAARLTKSPRDLMIAEKTADLIAASRRFKNGFSFQTGAGAIAIATTKYLGDRMRAGNVKASFALGGIPKAIIDLYDEGMIRVVECSQSFDADSANAILSRERVLEIDNSDYAYAYNKGCFLNREDFGVLGALEMDTDFNVNILTGANGKMMGGLGGGPDVAACAAIPIVALPLIRNRMPCVVKRVLTVCTPGETVAAAVTEAGIALNPRHRNYQELKEDLEKTDLKVISIDQLQQMAEKLTGVPEAIATDSRIACIVEYRDGSVIDVIRCLKASE